MWTRAADPVCRTATKALMEMDDGTVAEVSPVLVRFLDSKDRFSEFAPFAGSDGP